MKNVTATSTTAYVQNELSTARLAIDELKNYIAKCMIFINNSSKKDHFYGVAGDIISGVPKSLLKLEKSVNSAALAVDKLDYEELRQTIHPDKIEELERILNDVRLKIPRRTGK